MTEEERDKNGFQNSPVSCFLGLPYTVTPPEAENYSQAISDDIRRKEQIKAATRERKQREKLENERKAKEIIKEQSRVVRDGSMLQAEIMKGLLEGKGIGLLFLKALELVELLTGERSFPQQAKDCYLDIYGEGLLQEEPLKDKLASARRRLRKLTKAAERPEFEEGEKRRILRAIEAHKADIERLKGLIEQGKEEGGE